MPTISAVIDPMHPYSNSYSSSSSSSSSSGFSSNSSSSSSSSSGSSIEQGSASSEEITVLHFSTCQNVESNFSIDTSSHPHTTEKDDVQQKAQHHQGVKTTETKVTRATEKETSPHVKPRIQIQPGATCSAKISPKPTSSEPITSHSAPRGSIKHGKTLIQQMPEAEKKKQQHLQKVMTSTTKTTEISSKKFDDTVPEQNTEIYRQIEFPQESPIEYMIKYDKIEQECQDGSDIASATTIISNIAPKISIINEDDSEIPKLEMPKQEIQEIQKIPKQEIQKIPEEGIQEIPKPKIQKIQKQEIPKIPQQEIQEIPEKEIKKRKMRELIRQEKLKLEEMIKYATLKRQQILKLMQEIPILAIEPMPEEIQEILMPKEIQKIQKQEIQKILEQEIQEIPEEEINNNSEMSELEMQEIPQEQINKRKMQELIRQEKLKLEEMLKYERLRRQQILKLMQEIPILAIEPTPEEYKKIQEILTPEEISKLKTQKIQKQEIQKILEQEVQEIPEEEINNNSEISELEMQEIPKQEIPEQEIQEIPQEQINKRKMRELIRQEKLKQEMLKYERLKKQVILKQEIREIPKLEIEPMPEVEKYDMLESLSEKIETELEIEENPQVVNNSDVERSEFRQNYPRSFKPCQLCSDRSTKDLVQMCPFHKEDIFHRTCLINQMEKSNKRSLEYVRDLENLMCRKYPQENYRYNSSTLEPPHTLQSPEDLTRSYNSNICLVIGVFLISMGIFINLILNSNMWGHYAKITDCTQKI